LRVGIGTPGVAAAQIGGPLRRGATLNIALPDGGSVLGTRVGRSGSLQLAESGGRWTVKAHS
jgi:hypothetical protein